MNVVDILVAIVVVTILVTIILSIVTYVAYKLRLSREPAMREEDPTGLRYFVRYDPPGVEDEAGDGASASGETSALDQLDRDVADLEGHAAET